MILPVILFAVAAAGGVSIAVLRFRGQPAPPMALALLHGGVAAAALIAMFAVALRPGVRSPFSISLAIFVAAAMGGFFLFSYHLRKKSLPIVLVLGHGLMAVVAFVVLLLALAHRL